METLLESTRSQHLSRLAAWTRVSCEMESDCPVGFGDDCNGRMSLKAIGSQLIALLRTVGLKMHWDWERYDLSVRLEVIDDGRQVPRMGWCKFEPIQ